MMMRSAAFAATVLLVGIGNAHAAQTNGIVQDVDAPHKTITLVGGGKFALTDTALAKAEGMNWERRNVILIYEDKGGQRIASDVILTGNNVQQEKLRQMSEQAKEPAAKK